MRTATAFETNPLQIAVLLAGNLCGPNAGQTYVFTDTDHPTTTHLHALFAKLVERAVTAAK